MRTYKPVFGTYRLTTDTTAQAMRVAESYRLRGWRCTTRGRRLVLTTHEEAYLDPDTPGDLWQLDRSAHEVACREWLVPELRGSRRRAEPAAAAAPEGAAGEGDERGGAARRIGAEEDAPERGS